MDEVRAWQSRPLDSVYPILYLDALQVKVKSQGRVRKRAGFSLGDRAFYQERY
jgi:putative transposase